MQIITITGYLSRDAEQRTTRDGTPVTNWNVPVRQGWGENERTNWYKVSIWGKRADFAAKARKGEFVTVTGELIVGEWEGKLQLEVRANDFQSVLTAKREDAPSGERKQSYGSDSSDWGGDNAATFADELDSEVPF